MDSIIALLFEEFPNLPPALIEQTFVDVNKSDFRARRKLVDIIPSDELSAKWKDVSMTESKNDGDTSGATEPLSSKGMSCVNIFAALRVFRMYSVFSICCPSISASYKHKNSEQRNLFAPLFHVGTRPFSINISKPRYLFKIRVVNVKIR